MVTADDGQRALAIQMAAYQARVVHNNCVVGTPDTPRTAAAGGTTKHVVMNTPSMYNVAADANAPADVTVGGGHGDAAGSDEPSDDRSLLTRHSTTDVSIRRYQLQPDLQTV